MTDQLLTYEELYNYVQSTGETGRYYGMYVGGFLKGRTCSILYETVDSSICHFFISPYMRFIVNA